MRNPLQIVLAEDDLERQKELRIYLETYGDYSVAVTRSIYAVERLIESTNAAWLVLDLELEDGNATEIVGPLREKFGTTLFILILTGYWERFPEQRLISDGADIVLRKPYSPEALVQQLAKIRSGWAGGSATASGKLEKVALCKGELNLSEGIFRTGRRHIRFTNQQRIVVEILAQTLRAGPYARVGRGEMVAQLYGHPETMDERQAFGDRLRATIVRIRKLTGCDEFIVNERESNNSSWYRFGGNPIILEQD